MRTTPITRRIRHAGAIASLSVLALIANPAPGSATITGGNADVTASGSVITVEFTGVVSDDNSFLTCAVGVKDTASMVHVVWPQVVPTSGIPKSGTFTSNELPDGDYLVEAACDDAAGFAYFTPAAGEPVTLPAPAGGMGSLEQLLDLFGM